jgi:hypothetical protein
MESRFRLRIEDQIVGYRKEIEGISFYSKDSFWWSGNAIESSQQDACMFLKDKNNRVLYEQDIIQFSTHPTLYFILHFDATLSTFQLIDFETKSIFANNAIESLMNAESTTWLSYAFINHLI